MLKHILYFSFIVLLIAGCKKKELPLPENTPVTSPPFAFSMLVNGMPASQSGGVSGYYMYSSYSHDPDVYIFKAEIKPTSCNNCPNSLSVALRDAQTTTGSQTTNIGNAVYQGYFPYHLGATAGSISYTLSFSSQTTADTYHWDFGDGDTSSQANPVHTYARPGTYTVTLSTISSGCSSNLSNVYKVGVPGSGCQIANVYSSSNAGVVTFHHTTTGTAPFTYAWDLGDGTTSTLSNPTHTYATPGIYHTSLQVTDALGNSAVCKYDYLSVGFSGCTTAFSQGGITAVSNPYGFSNIVITWSDAVGNVYTSDNAAQPASSYFQILSVEDFDDNELGQHTKKIHIKFSCTVYNGTNSLTLTNADAVIAVAYH